MLGPDALDECFELAVNAGLSDPQRRSLLLAWLPAGVIASLETKPSPADQLRSDLHILNTRRLSPDQPAIVVWLENAERLVSYLPGVPEKLRALRRRALDDAAPQPEAPQPAPAPRQPPPPQQPTVVAQPAPAPPVATAALRLVIAGDRLRLLHKGAEIWARTAALPAELTVAGGRHTVPQLRTALASLTWDRAALIDLGDALQSALFGGPAPAAVAAAFQAEYRRDRLVLDLDRDAAQLPWEYLRIGRDFVGEHLVVLRHHRVPGGGKPLTWTDRLGEISFVSANLPDMDPFNEGLHAGEIQEGLGRENRGLFTPYAACTEATLLRDALRRGVQALHFLGHGTARGLKLIAVHRGDVHGDRRPSTDIAPTKLASNLRKVGDSLRYVFLGACHGAAAKATGDDLSGVAQTIVERTGVPVIAMQTAVPQDYSTAFARGFYEALADQRAHGDHTDLIAAFDAARDSAASELWFGIPVLYADFSG